MYGLVLFVLLSLAWLWPLPLRLGSRIAHDPGDPVLNAWILWWNAQAVPGSERWWNAPVFHPMLGAFALSEHLAGIGLFTAPLTLSGVNAIAAYNLALIAACALCGLFVFLLVRDLTGSTIGGLVAGIAFAFSPYRAGQLAHLQVLTAQWMPLALLAMHRYLSSGSKRWLPVLAGAWLLQALSNGYFLLYFPVLAALWLLWFGTGPDRRVNRRRALTLAATFALSSLMLMPVLWRYKQVHSGLGIARSVDEMVRFSASFDALFAAAPLAAFWPKGLTVRTQEAFLFPGVTLIALAFAGGLVVLGRQGWRWSASLRSPILFYLLAGITFFWLAMGPQPDGGPLAALLHPYTLLTYLPGYEGLRAPARFATLGILCLSIVAGIAVAAGTPGRRWLRVVAGAAIFSGLFVDGWTDPLPLVTPPQRVMFPPLRDGAVLELPAYDIDVNLGAMYRSMAHRMPLVNGFSGHTPEHYSVLNTALLREDPSVLWWLAGGRPLVVLVHRAHDTEGAVRQFIERSGGVLQTESGVGPVFVLPPRPRPRAYGQSGTALPNVQVTEPSRGITVADLGRERSVRTVSFDARWRHAEIPARITVEVSLDGTTWSTAFEDWTGSLLLAASLSDQRRVTVEIPLRDARTRYVRIQPAPSWLAGELRVNGANP